MNKLFLFIQLIIHGLLGSGQDYSCNEVSHNAVRVFRSDTTSLIESNLGFNRFISMDSSIYSIEDFRNDTSSKTNLWDLGTYWELREYSIDAMNCGVVRHDIDSSCNYLQVIEFHENGLFKKSTLIRDGIIEKRTLINSNLKYWNFEICKGKSVMDNSILLKMDTLIENALKVDKVYDFPSSLSPKEIGDYLNPDQPVHPLYLLELSVGRNRNVLIRYQDWPLEQPIKDLILFFEDL